MKAIILAAGYGTRLYPLTLNKPKALLEVGNKTILERLLQEIFSLKECGHVYIVSNEKFFGSFFKWVKEKKLEKKVTVLNDGTKSNEDRLGAIGDMNFAVNKEKLDDDIIVLGSDNLFNFKLKNFVDFAAAKAPYASLALFDVKDIKKAGIYGIAVLEAGTKEVVDFEEKPEKPKSTLAATCIYFYPKKKIRLLPEYMKSGFPEDAPGNFIKWLKEKEKVYGYVFKNGWYDIGDKESLKKADQEYTNKEKGKL